MRNAMQHAGSAVVFSGTTVAISLLALSSLPVPFLRSIGIAGLLIALVSVAVAVTLLPVVLATIGPKLDWPRNAARRPRQPRLVGVGPPRRPPPLGRRASSSTAVLAALVVAASSIQLGNPRADSLAQAGPARAALEKLERVRHRHRPALAVRRARPLGRPRRRRRRAAQSVDGVRSAAAPADWRRDGTALVTVIPTEDGNSPAGPRDARPHPRRRATLPADVSIGGEAAQSADFLDAVYSNFPLMLALISVLTFLLLARAFRSLILPLKAVLLNLLSVGAAWGLIVLVWQNGFGSDAIWGIEATQAINVEMPIVIFAFLFGVSMDYQVFIISRMREAYDRTGSTETAVVEGIGRTGPPGHERGADPRPRVRRLQRRARHRGQDLRNRARRRDPDRRDAHPRRPRARRRRPPRPLELVAPGLGGAPAARGARRALGLGLADAPWGDPAERDRRRRPAGGRAGWPSARRRSASRRCGCRITCCHRRRSATSTAACTRRSSCSRTSPR